MNGTYTIQQSLNWASQFCRLAPLSNVGGTANEPALTIANTIIQTILAPPFKWRWNRILFTLQVPLGVASVNVSPNPGIGYIESVQVGPTQLSPQFEVEIKQGLMGTDSNSKGRPTFISTAFETASGLTFNFEPTPDQTYVAFIGGQAVAPSLSSLASPWPMPDHMGFVYNTGFLAYAMLYMQHPSFPLMFQRFLSGLVGVAEGLTEQDKSAFMGENQRLIMSQQSQAENRQLAERSRYSIQG